MSYTPEPNSGPFYKITTDDFFSQAASKNEYVGTVELSKDQYRIENLVMLPMTYCKSYFTKGISHFNYVDEHMTQVSKKQEEIINSITDKTNFQQFETTILSESLKYLDIP